MKMPCKNFLLVAFLCVHKVVSKCSVDDDARLGNGLCDGGNYNIESCEFDGGDCVPSMDFVGSEVSSGLQEQLYRSSTLGPDEMVYGIPWNSPQILKFDPATETSSFVGSPMEGPNKWWGGCSC